MSAVHFRKGKTRDCPCKGWAGHEEAGKAAEPKGGYSLQVKTGSRPMWGNPTQQPYYYTNSSISELLFTPSVQ